VMVLRERTHRSGLQYALDNLGWAALVRGDHEQAKTLFRESLALTKALGDRGIATESLEGLACVAGVKGEAVRAARLFGAARALQETGGYQQSADQRALREPYLIAARSCLEDAVWEVAFAEGQAMTFEEGKGMGLDEAFEYALSEEASTLESPAPEQMSASTPASPLTRREEEISILVARGLTNRQIATELSISEHTAATHVRRILKKLGLQSRSQIGSWLAEQRP
jgi:DNA-binding CsgD family transcriptional regulator